ncbi:MAG TPA: hypothetical protein VL173_02090 [Vicinamibacterales bacterium]|jgi:hypothetical protein|nr:hypothetical protein [Vicinamibacterales bacterium]
MRIAIPLVLLLTLVVGLPHEASACECVAVPSAIKPESKGVLAIGTVRDIRPVDPDGWYTKAVVIDITDGLRNATAAETITYLRTVR